MRYPGMGKSVAASLTTALIALAFVAFGQGVSASADELSDPKAETSAFTSPGPHTVSTTADLHPCREAVYGMIEHVLVHAFGNTDDPQCSTAFPNGLDSPIGVQFYYPTDIADSSAAPLLVWGGGILSEPGNYAPLATLWASRGFVVAIAYDYINSLPEIPTLGLTAAITANRDPNSPLHGKVDVSRTIFGGHSAGGGGALQAGAIFPPIEKLIDPDLHVLGVLAVQPGPLALGSAVTVPTLYITGYNDFVVPDFGWVRWWQSNQMTQAPSWIVNARGTTHFSPLEGVENFNGAGAATAWLQYTAFGDLDAEKYFVGEDWLLPHDEIFFTAERNPLADALN